MKRPALAAKRKALRAELIAAGVMFCSKCLKPWDRHDKRRTCPTCRAYDAKRWANGRGAKRFRALKRLGICTLGSCGQKAIPGGCYCGYHREQISENAAKVRAENKAKGLCPCGGRLSWRPVFKSGPKKGQREKFKYCAKCRACFKETSRLRRAGIKAGGRVLRLAKEKAA